MIRSKAENKATLDMTSHMLNDYLMRSLRLSDPTGLRETIVRLWDRLSRGRGIPQILEGRASC